MPNLDIYQLKTAVEPSIRKGTVTSRILLGRSRFIEQISTKSPSFNDPSFFPAYYYLAKHIKPKKVVELGVGLGLRGAAVCQGAKVEFYLGLQKPFPGEHYSVRMSSSNIRDYITKYCPVMIHQGSITDREFHSYLVSSKWDLAVVGEELTYEEHRERLAVIFEQVVEGGFMAVDHTTKHEPLKRAIKDFCRVSNRDYLVLKTRYGVALVQK